MSESKFLRLKDCTSLLPKSNILAGGGTPYGKYPFYLSGQEVGRIDEAMSSKDAVVMGTGGVATAVFAQGEYAYSSGNFAFISKRKDLKIEYLFRVVEFFLPEIDYKGFQGSGLKHIDKPFFFKLRVALPPLAEQRKIAAVLISVDEVIEGVQKQINKLQDLKKATMNELLKNGTDGAEGFFDVHLSDVIAVKNDSKSHITASDYQDSGVLPIIDQGKNFICGFTSDIGKKYSKPLPVIVFGDHTLCTKYIDFPFAVGADGTQIIKPADPNDNHKYLYYVISREALIMGSGGYKRHLNILKKRVVPFTKDASQQRKIAAVLSSMDNTIEEKQRKLRKLQSLKNALMQDLLTGKVRT